MTADELVDRSRALALARAAFGDAPGVVVYVDRVPRGPGPVQAGLNELSAERSSLLVFRDELPGANWMHPCAYALVDLGSGLPVATVAADRPPSFGFLPDTWIVVSDPDGRADLVRPNY